MAGVAVIQPADVVKQRVNYGQGYAKPKRSRRNSTSNPLPTPNPNKNNNRRKRSPQKNGSSPDNRKNLHLVMGEVKILKRGEVLNVVKENKVEDLVLSTTDPDLGPETEVEQMTIADFYAGSAFVSSPPPSSLPVPAFFKKKIEDNHDATIDLRRLLRLHLS